jgi:hypothetical protein
MNSEVTVEAPSSLTADTTTSTISTLKISACSLIGDSHSSSVVGNNADVALQNGTPSTSPRDDFSDEDPTDIRIGTISSARFNILSTMVGGGCLSLPLAFQQSGNALMAPLVLLATALITDFCFRLLVSSSVFYIHQIP